MESKLPFGKKNYQLMIIGVVIKEITGDEGRLPLESSKKYSRRRCAGFLKGNW